MWIGIAINLLIAAVNIPFMLQGFIFNAAAFGFCIGITFCMLCENLTNK